MIACYGLLFVMWCDEPPRPPVIVTCPAIASWSQQYQNDLADQTAGLSPDSPLALAMREHIRLRAQLRKCRNASKKRGLDQ